MALTGNGMRLITVDKKALALIDEALGKVSITSRAVVFEMDAGNGMNI